MSLKGKFPTRLISCLRELLLLTETIPISRDLLFVTSKDDITKRYLSTKCKNYQYVLSCIERKEFDESNINNEPLIQEFTFEELPAISDNNYLVKNVNFSKMFLGSTHFRDFHDFDLKVIIKLAMLEFLSRTAIGTNVFRDFKYIEMNSEFKKLDYSVVLKKDKDFSGCEIRIPFVFALVIDGIKKRALEMEDIFRKSMKFSSLMDFYKDLHKSLSSDSNNISEIVNYFKKVEPMLLCSILKMLLQNFNSLFPINVLKFLYSLPTIKEPELTIVLYQCLMLQIPEPERSVLDSVLRLLSTVVQHQVKNKMCIKAIATLFAPVLLNPDQDSVSSAIDVLIQMIHYRELIFLIPQNVISVHRNDNVDKTSKVERKKYIGKKSNLTGNGKSIVLCHFKHTTDGDFLLEDRNEKLTEDNLFSFKYKRRVLSLKFTEKSTTKDAINVAIKEISTDQPDLRLYTNGGNIHQLCLHPKMQLIKAMEDNCSGQFFVDLAPEYDNVKSTLKSLYLYLKIDVI